MLPRKLLSLHSINLLFLLAYCYLGSIKTASVSFDLSLLSTISIGCFFFTSLLILYLNRTEIFRLLRTNKKINILILFTVLATASTNTIIFAAPMIFALTAINKDLRTLLGYYFVWSIILFTGIVFMSLTGLITDGYILQKSTNGVDVVAQSLGFGNPNGAFTYLFSILTVGYTLLYRSQRKILLTLIALPVCVTIYGLTASRTGLACCAMLVLFAHTGRLIHWRRVKAALPSLFIALIILSIILALCYGQMGNPINDLMSNRPYWWALRINDGQLSNLLGNVDYFAKNYMWWRDTAPLDSFFLRVWFRYGLLLLIFYFVLFWSWSKSINNPMLIFSAAIMLLYGFSEYGIMSNPGKSVILLILVIPFINSYMSNQSIKFFRGSHAR